MSSGPGEAAWFVGAASAIGSVHVRDQRPNQDAALVWAEGGFAVITVADGHGHHLHFRSDVGSALATRCALDALQSALPTWPDADAAREALPETAAQIVAAWRAAVEEHVAENPIAEVDGAALHGDVHLAYGATLLAVASAPGFMAALQIGDGDTVFVRASGEAFRPLPHDDALDGVHTPSLCQEDPIADLRDAVVDLGEDDVSLAYICTDGFGTARVDPLWWSETGTQLRDLVTERGAAWVAEQLPGWLEEPAQVGGDDTTMAIVCSRAPATVRIDVLDAVTQ